MRIISQVRLSTFDGGKTYNAEVKIGDQFFGVTADAAKTLLAEHKRLGGVTSAFAPRQVTIKNAARAAAYGRKVGDVLTVRDYATRTLAFDAAVGDGVIGYVENVELVTLAFSGEGLDIGEVREVKASAAPAAPADTPDSPV